MAYLIRAAASWRFDLNRSDSRAASIVEDAMILRDSAR